MQIELSNGLDHVWQWDPQITITVVSPEDAESVHFRWGGRAVELHLDNHTVDIPPELMQYPRPIRLWAYKPDHTMDFADIQVYPKQKPTDYAYTPTEIKTWEQLDERIKALEKGGGVAGVTSVNGKTGTVELTAEDVGAATPEDVTSAVESATENLQPKGDYITQDKLQSATDKALAQAKASGEFDGPQGPKGDQGDTGPQGPAGADGAPGKDGITPTIGDNGNWFLGDTDTGKPSRGESGKDVVLCTITGDSTFAADMSCQEIVDAYNAGKVVHAVLQKTNQLFNLSSISSTSVGFTCPTKDGVNRELSIEINGTVTLSTKYLQIANLTQEITSKSTNSQYPSARAVYDYVNASAGMNITGATVGQVPQISAVDDNGKPTAWKAVDMASGGESAWTLLADVNLSEDSTAIAITKTPSGETFSVNELIIFGEPVGDGTHRDLSFFLYKEIAAQGIPHITVWNVLSASDGATSYLATHIQVFPKAIFARTQYSLYNVGIGTTNNNSIFNSTDMRTDANEGQVAYAMIGNPVTQLALGAWSAGISGVLRAGTKIKVYGR